MVLITQTTHTTRCVVQQFTSNRLYIHTTHTMHIMVTTRTMGNMHTINILIHKMHSIILQHITHILKSGQ